MRTLSQKSRARPDTSLYPGGPLLYAWSLIINITVSPSTVLPHYSSDLAQDLSIGAVDGLVIIVLR